MEESKPLGILVMNLTTKSFVKGHKISSFFKNIELSRPYDEIIESFSKNILIDEVAEKFRRDMCSQKMLDNYIDNELLHRMEFPYSVSENYLVWIAIFIELEKDEYTGDIIERIYMFDIQTEKLPKFVMDAIMKQDFVKIVCVDFVAGTGRTYNCSVENGWNPTLPLELVQQEKSLQYMKIYYGDDKEKFISENTITNIASKMNDKVKYSVDYRYIGKDGDIRNMRENYYWIDSLRQYLCITSMDITSVVEREQRINNRLNEVLDEAKETNRKLEDANNALTIASNAKRDFLSRMSHDIRTPMNAIIGMTALAFDEIDNPEAMRDYLTKIKSSSEFLLSLVNDVLDMEKIESGKMQLKMEPYTYESFAKNMKTMFEPLCREKNIKFEFPEMNGIGTIITDETRLNQIFFNLLSNAVKFTPEGGTVSYVVEKVEERDGIQINDSVVMDTGIGMSKEFQNEMFKEFARDESVENKVQGTGLGLSIAKNLVEMMGGCISVESELGKGTKIRVHMEYKLADKDIRESDTAKKSSVDISLLEDKKILLAEDHPLNTEIAKKLLEKKGMFVSCAGNGKEAVDMFKASELNYYDAILMDIRMPVMDGLCASTEIRKLERNDAAEIPIIAMTANAYESDREKSKNAGMTAHLTKPINAGELYRVLAENIV